MGFEGLLGNQRLKENLTGSLRRGRISHFYLISGPEGSGKHTLARLLAAAILCQDQQNPCLRCNHCRKVLADTHPDFVTVTDPEHKNIAVKIVRDIRDDMFIRPNEGSHKLYLFAQDLGVEGQNALLKVLEEPPAYGVFIIMTDNPEKLLPTVRSRCTELSLQPLPEATMKSWLTREFPQAEPETVAAAAYHLSVLGIACIFVCLMVMTGGVLQAYGHEYIPVLSLLAGGAVKVAANYLLGIQIGCV